MRLRTLAIGIVIGFALAPAVQAQDAGDQRWTPWMGCWHLIDENVREGGPDDAADPAEWEKASKATDGIRVCVTPGASPASATMTTTIEQQTSLEETIIADGSRRAVADSGCAGWQRTEWSSNGLRLFSRAELTCADQTPRTVSGLVTMAPNGHWLDVQVVQVAGRESIRIRRYKRAPDQQAKTTTAAKPYTGPLSFRFTVEEVAEASTKLLPSALEAALIETNSTFPLNARRLVALDDAGVPDRVIDLMVALSFPKKFVVERSVSSSASSGYTSSSYGGSGFGDPWFWGIDSYYSMPYYYAPFGYSYFGNYDQYYYGTPTYFVSGGGGGGGDVTVAPSGAGRVVDGRGYTRISERQPAPVNAGGHSGYSGESGPSGGSGSAGGGNVSSGGYSSGGSGGGGGGGGVTAVARPPL